MPGFVQTVLQSAQPHLSRIIHSNFISQIGRGILPRKIHDRFLALDCRYLRSGFKPLLIRFASVVHEVHRSTVQQFVIDTDAEIEHLEKSSSGMENPDFSCNASWDDYIALLCKMASEGSVEEIAAAAGPCFVFFRELSKHFKSLAIDEGHPYGAWIRIYTSAEFSVGVQKMVTIIDHYADNGDEKTREKMTSAFLKSAEHEGKIFSLMLPDNELPFWSKPQSETQRLLDAARIGYGSTC